jgi:hypothetical protein
MTWKVRYSTNQMGPWHLDWYRQRGLIRKVTKVIEKETPWCDKKVGDVVEYNEITERYAGGRIDFWNNLEPDSMFPDEMSVPPMRYEDWCDFGKWLDTFETDFPWTLAQLVELYERNNPKIRWWKDENNN